MNRQEQSEINLIKRVADADRRGVIKNQTIAAKLDAEDILSQARAESDRILQRAKEDAERVLEKAYLEGIERSITEIEKHLIEVREMRLNVLREAEKDLLKLSVRIAEKILGKELASSKKAITDIVSTALRNARQREKVTVMVHPSDFEQVKLHSEKYASDEGIRLLDFVADISVPVGGCVIETEVGKIDARLETQFRVIENALLSRSENEKSDVITRSGA